MQQLSICIAQVRRYWRSHPLLRKHIEDTLTIIFLIIILALALACGMFLPAY